MKFRTVSFRDDVLWAIARKAGLDPTEDFHDDLADAYASFINAWVRKLWDSIDWPEWTEIIARTPEPTLGGHYIPYDPDIGRVLKVYLANPEVTPGPVDAPFRLLEKGIFLGFDHGSTVWIKHIIRAPSYTAKKWNINDRYSKGDLRYSPVTGECYKSLLSGNSAIDPATEGALSMNAPTLIQEFNPTTPAVPEVSEVWNVKIRPPTWYNLINTVFTFTITDTAGVQYEVKYTTPADGGSIPTALAGIAAAFAASPDPFVTGLTVTTDTPSATVQLELLTAGFSAKANVFNADEGSIEDLTSKHVRTHIDAVLRIGPTPQKTELFFSDNLEGIPATYNLVITDNAGVQHTAEYIAPPELSIAEIMLGIVRAIENASLDVFFGGLVVVADLANAKMTFVLNQAAQIQLTATSNVPRAWELVPFPFALCDAVVRGALSDAMREEGQTDKAQAEEQAAGTEDTGRVTATTGPDYDVLTDQEAVRSRYRVA